MNTKIEFKGSVNGTEYDNVKDYNEALSKAIKEGNLSNASSSTKVVSCSDNLLMTPGFNPARICSSYLNNDNNPEENLEDILKKIDEYDEAELTAYNDAVSEIQDTITCDEDRLNKEKEACQKKLETIEKQLENNAKYEEVYDTIAEKLDSKLPKKAENNEVEKKSCKNIWEQLWEDLFEPF